MIQSGALYKLSDAAADFCGISEKDFLAAVEVGEAPRPIASNMPDARRLWRSADLWEWLAKKAKSRAG